jgi:hypothetical protein
MQWAKAFSSSIDRSRHQLTTSRRRSRFGTARLIQQFIIKYGQIGIAIPFTDIIFKPTPPLVPASTVLLMVIILLILPNGLLGKKE